MIFTKFYQKLVKREHGNWLNENTKPVEFAIMNDEVRKAFNDFVSLVQNLDNFLLIGGIALGAYQPARNTMDIDFAVLSKASIDQIFAEVSSKFKKHRASAIEHKTTGVEIEFVYPEFININPELLNKAFEEARIDVIGGKKIKVISPKYLIAMKLGRASGTNNKAIMDQFDIRSITTLYGKQDLSNLEGILKPEEMTLYEKLATEADKYFPKRIEHVAQG